MMKRFLRCFAVIGLVSCAMLTACDDEEEIVEDPDDVAGTSVSLSVGTTNATSVILNIASAGLADYAYLCYEEDEDIDSAPEESVLYRTGTTGECTGDVTAVTIPQLLVNTSYHAYFAFRTTEGSYYGEVLDVTFTTGNYSDPLTVAYTTYDGFAVHIIVPEETVNRGNVLRYNVSNIFVHNNLGSLDANSLTVNGQHYIKTDSTLVYNDANIYGYDENGEIATDDYGVEVYNHDPYVPGEPLYFFMGEFSWGEAPYANWSDGYYTALFDYDSWYADNDTYDDEAELLSVGTKASQADYWTGYYENTIITTTAPDVLDANIDVSVDAYATRANITFTPDENIVMYTFLVIDDATYKSSLLPLLDNNEDYMQWFVTSYAANVYLSTITADGPMIYAAEDYFGTSLQPEVLYHVFITGFGNEEGTSQMFAHAEFETTAKTEAAPEVVVTAIENPSGTESPYEAWFNIKAPNHDMEYGNYAANYERDWAATLKSYTYNEVAELGNSFSDAELSLINSADGYDMMFATRASSTTILAVVGYNSEDTPNEITGADDPAVASQTTMDEVLGDRVESSLFDDLIGDWTAVYSVKADTYHAAGKYKNKVTISAGVTYPDQLDESVYEAYYALGDTWTQEMVDELYAEFKSECDDYNASVRGNNRLLCMGFGVDMETATPYELFTADSDTYNAYNNEATLFDFGPKWYLEIHEDGTVTAPFNSTRMYPMSSFTSSYGSALTYYFMGRGVSSDSYTASYVSVGDDYENLEFPVTVSEDKNTITVGSITDDSDTYYPNAGRLNSSYVVYGKGIIISDIVLTRGWEDDTETASVASIETEKSPLAGDQPMSRVKLRTPFNNLVQYGHGTAKVINQESFNEARLRMYEDYKSGKLAK